MTDELLDKTSRSQLAQFQEPDDDSKDNGQLLGLSDLQLKNDMILALLPADGSPTTTRIICNVLFQDPVYNPESEKIKEDVSSGIHDRLDKLASKGLVIRHKRGKISVEWSLAGDLGYSEEDDDHSDPEDIVGSYVHLNANNLPDSWNARVYAVVKENPYALDGYQIAAMLYDIGSETISLEECEDEVFTAIEYLVEIKIIKELFNQGVGTGLYAPCT